MEVTVEVPAVESRRQRTSEVMDDNDSSPPLKKYKGIVSLLKREQFKLTTSKALPQTKIVLCQRGK